MLRLIDKSKIYFYLLMLVLLLSIHNTNFISGFYNFFKINNIKITGNFDEKFHNDLKISLKKFYNKSIFSESLNDINSTINSYNIISEFKVKKQYPSSINIELQKTEILAYFFDDSQKTFIGANGKKIRENKIVIDGLPLLIGEIDINQFLNLKKILITHGFKLKDFNKYYFYKSKRWDLIYKDNITLKLPERNLLYSVSLFKQIIENQNIKNLKIIDLRIKDKIILL